MEMSPEHKEMADVLWRTEATSMVATSQEDSVKKGVLDTWQEKTDSQYTGTSYLSVPVCQGLPVHRVSNPYGFFLVHEEMEQDPNRRWRFTRDG